MVTNDYISFVMIVIILAIFLKGNSSYTIKAK